MYRCAHMYRCAQRPDFDAEEAGQRSIWLNPKVLKQDDVLMAKVSWCGTRNGWLSTAVLRTLINSVPR